MRIKNSIVFISNAFGGIKTFQDTLIKFIIKKEIECTLIDGKKFRNCKKKELKFYKINVLREILNTFKLLQRIKKKIKTKKQSLYSRIQLFL